MQVFFETKKIPFDFSIHYFFYQGKHKILN